MFPKGYSSFKTKSSFITCCFCCFVFVLLLLFFTLFQKNSVVYSNLFGFVHGLNINAFLEANSLVLHTLLLFVLFCCFDFTSKEFSSIQ